MIEKIRQPDHIKIQLSYLLLKDVVIFQKICHQMVRSSQRSDIWCCKAKTDSGREIRKTADFIEILLQKLQIVIGQKQADHTA